MPDDLKARLTKMAAEARDPADRQWAAAKLAAKFGGDTEPSAAAATPPAAAPEGPGLLSRAASAIPGMASKAYDAAHTFANGFNQSFAFGLPGRILDMAGATTPQGRAQEAQASPIAAGLGSGTGMATSALLGPEAAAGRTAQGLLGMAEQKIPQLATTLPGRILGAGAAGAVTGAQAGAGGVAAQGGDVQDVGSGALEGAKLGGIVGGGLGASGEVASRIARAIRGSQGGQSRQLIERYGGNVGPLDSGSGGAFNQELQGLPANDRGIGQASRARAANILNDTAATHEAETVLPSASAKGAIAASEAGQQMRDATPIYSQLVQLSRSQRLTPSEHGQVNTVLNQMDDLLKTRGSVQMTETELNDFKGMLQDLSDTGSMTAPTVARAKLQGVAHSTKEMVDQGPYADINARTSQGIQRYENQRTQLGLKPQPSGGKPSPEGPSEEELAYLANALARQDQNTVTSGLRNADRFGEFAEENPRYRRDIELPDVLRAKAELSLHAGKGHGGLINRLPPGMGLGASAALGLAGHGPISLAPIAAEFGARNWPAITGRLLYTPAMEAEAALGGGPRALPGFIPQIEAEYQAAMDRIRQRRQGQRQ